MWYFVAGFALGVLTMGLSFYAGLIVVALALNKP